VTITLDQITARLAAHAPRYGADLDADAEHAIERRAAVAIILRESDVSPRDTEIMFIRRAIKPGDPWSGHMAFPGGHIDPEDATYRDAAIRETLEEVGVDLTICGDHIGSLEPQRPTLRSLLVAPFVFRLRDPVACEPNHEVAEVVWTPLTPILHAHNHVEEMLLIEGSQRGMSGYQVGDEHLVWGLTYRILHSFFEVIDPEWREPG
jgi:8-oxo-dGTP pyrophosphatase MutT (NUDIX family)